MHEAGWIAQATCSRSCSKKLDNPSKRPEVAAKVSRTLRRIGHKPSVRGGNGKGLTGPQSALLAALGAGWVPEHVVNVWKGTRQAGIPGHYKIDIANPALMIAIEVDGSSHCPKARQEQDDRKSAFLAGEGWSVFRVSNEKALSLSTTCKSADILRILQAGT
ncbi:endonuclease domain-containing protein [Paracoccus sp. PS1]|uniref:endonuclease domain-containing protein n=1 Tax=Paracoccus sp. PS1 TaxID=2963938 RepID=UPI00391877E0